MHRALRAGTVVAVTGSSIFASAGTVFADAADPGPIGFSPSREVVQFAPYAVSVTFGTPLRDSGASMSIRTKAGEVGTGTVSTGSATLRRAVRAGAPNGVYTVDWAAVARDGQKMSGTFRFTAGHPNDDSSAPGSPSEGSAVPPGRSGTKDPWADDGDSAATPSRPGPSSNRRPPYGFPLFAMVLGALLVGASGLVSRRHRPVVEERLTVRTRHGVYSA